MPLAKNNPNLLSMDRMHQEVKSGIFLFLDIFHPIFASLKLQLFFKVFTFDEMLSRISTKSYPHYCLIYL